MWSKFCATYEAIYDRLGEFDDWYVQQNTGVIAPSLQKEWKEYIRVVLDSAVLRSRAQFDTYYDNKRYVFEEYFRLKNIRKEY